MPRKSLQLACLTALAATAHAALQGAHPNYRLSPLDGSVIALPTPDQLSFQDKEIGMLIHFEIATYLPIDGCNNVPGLVPAPSLFSPSQLDTDQWMRSVVALGARYATLVAKHNCGFLNWPSDITFPTREGGTGRYNYSVAYSPVTRDVVRSFADSAVGVGVGRGFYYSTVVNNFLNVQDSVVNATWGPGEVRVSNETYDEIVFEHLTELWTGYGEMTELWFDGGWSESQTEQLRDMLLRYQPHANIFNSCTTNGTCLSSNAIRWIGTETGLPDQEIWSTGLTNDGGDPTSPYFAPAECDTTLQAGIRWFWGVDQPLRSLDEMIDVYHQTVGRNCLLELDLAPDRRGLVPEAHATRYQELGDFIRSCYGSSVAAEVTNTTTATDIVFRFDSPTVIDRVVIMEDQSAGQVIRAYGVYAKVVEPGNTSVVSDVPWTLVSSGQSIGHKRIDIFAEAITVTAISVNATKFVDTPAWRSVTFHLCGNTSSVSS
ncbi:family 29 glycoside hydrolase [Xylariaceae sp. FL1272]|nr:family 29 glycoside hydrolase [Xylariaceae sp. FL1272]